MGGGGGEGAWGLPSTALCTLFDEGFSQICIAFCRIIFSSSWRRNSQDYSSGCEHKIIVLWSLTFKQDPSPLPMLFSGAFQFAKGLHSFLFGDRARLRGV